METGLFFTIGIDPHKDYHYAVLLSPFGELLKTYEFDDLAIHAFYKDAINDINNFGEKLQGITKRKFGIENAYGYGIKPTKYLFGKKEVVLNVPTSLTEEARLDEIHLDKDDFLDACRVARCVLFHNPKIRLIQVTPKIETSEDLRLLVNERELLVRERTAQKNSLHALYYHMFDNYKEIVTYKNIFCMKAIKQMKDHLKDATDLRSTIIVKKLDKIVSLEDEIDSYEKQMGEVKSEDIEILKTIPKCSTAVAAKIMSAIKDIARFENPDKLAKYCGMGGVTSSSAEGRSKRKKKVGKKDKKGEQKSKQKKKHKKMRKDKRGQVKLKHTLYMLSVSHLGKGGVPKAVEYIKKKREEGFTGLEACQRWAKKLLFGIYFMLKRKEPFKYATGANGKIPNNVIAFPQQKLHATTVIEKKIKQVPIVACNIL